MHFVCSGIRSGLVSLHEGVAFHESSVGTSDESEYLLAFVGVAVAFFDFFDGMADGVAFLEDVAVDVGDVVDGFAAEPPALESEGIDTGIGDGVARRFDEGRDVFVDERASGGE